jgi:predicted acyltransferase (DUF342 family)
MNSWRQYGGIYANEKFQNIGVGTVVADKLLLRQQSLNVTKINGQLLVTESVDSSGQIIAQLGLVSLSDTYVKQKLFFGTTSLLDTNPYYITGDSRNGYIGINTQSPTYSLDINSDKINVLALRSSNVNAQSILGENSSKNGITSTVTQSSASLNFFVGTNVETGATPNNKISSTGQNLNISSNALLISSPVSISNTNYVSTLLATNFQIIAMKFSKTNPQLGFAVGTPTSISSFGYNQYFAKTTNGGNTWSLQSFVFSNNSSFGTSSETLNIFVYDSNNIYLASRNNNYFFYSTDAGATFTFVYDTTVTNSTKNFNTLYASNNKSGIQVIYLGGNTITLSNNVKVSTPQLFYIDKTKFTYNAIPSIQINEMDGVGNTMYVVGAGIQKYDLTNCPSNPPIAIYGSAYNSSSIYNCVYAYSANYVIAGGNGLISYTTDGITWNDVSLPGSNIKSVYIYDTTIAVAVGDSGAFFYTINGARSWSIVPFQALNASGIAAQIQTSNSNLSGIYMTDLNSFIISNVSSVYVAESQSITTYGASQIQYIYIPVLLNIKNSKVLDVSGNMGITGDLTMIGNAILSNNFTASGLVTANAGLTVAGGLTAQNDILVLGNTNLAKTLTIGGVMNANGGLSVTGTLNAQNDALISGNATVTKTLTANGGLFVTSTLTAQNDILVAGNATITKTLTANGGFSLVGNMLAQNDILVAGNASIAKTLTANGGFSLSGNMLAQNDILVAGNTTITKTLTANGSFSLAGIMTAQNDILVGGNATITNGITASGKVIAQNGLTVSAGPISLSGSTSQTGDLTITGNVIVNGSVTNFKINKYGVVQQFDN